MGFTPVSSKNTWRLWGLAGLAWLLALTLVTREGSLAQAQIRHPLPEEAAALAATQTPTPPEEAPRDIPRLETSPDGVFNRVREELIAQRERHQTLRRQVDEATERLGELRRRGHRLGDLRRVRDQLGELHRAIDALVEEADRTRAFIGAEVVPNLDPMISEVQVEIMDLEPTDPRREHLAIIERLLRHWSENPETVMEMFEGVPVGRSPSRSPWPIGEHPLLENHLIRRIERLERHQERLRHMLDATAEETRRLRAVLNHLSPEEIERLEQALGEEAVRSGPPPQSMIPSPPMGRGPLPPGGFPHPAGSPPP